MKKIIALLLALTMVLGLCACSDKKDQSTNKDTLENKQEKVFSKPTDEEQNEIWEFEHIVSVLDNYIEEGYIVYYDYDTETKVSGNQAMEIYYNQLLELESVDKWEGTEYASDKSRQEILSYFTILEDKLICATKADVDKLGNIDRFEKYQITRYNDQGLLTYVNMPLYNLVPYIEDQQQYITQHFSSWPSSPDYFYEYDDNGDISKINFGYKDKKDCIITPTYDGNGNIIRENIVHYAYEEDAVFSYDDENRLIQIEYNRTQTDYERKENYVYTYTYDNDGNILREDMICTWYSDYDKQWKIEEKSVTEYSYDSNGKLASGKHTYQWWNGNEVLEETVNVYQFTVDDQGRIATMVITYGDEKTIWNNTSREPEYATSTIEVVYGNYYVYNPSFD